MRIAPLPSRPACRPIPATLYTQALPGGVPAPLEVSEGVLTLRHRLPRLDTAVLVLA